MRGIRNAALGIARVIAACTVLAGLFFMHGLFTAGCHAAGGMPTAPMAAAPADGPAMMPAVGHHLAAGVSMADGMVSGSGSLCVSTPPPRPFNLADLLLALVTFGALNCAFSLSLSRRAVPTRRGPPPVAGAALLTTLCVSRT